MSKRRCLRQRRAIWIQWSSLAGALLVATVVLVQLAPAHSRSGRSRGASESAGHRGSTGTALHCLRDGCQRIVAGVGDSQSLRSLRWRTDRARPQKSGAETGIRRPVGLLAK
jgi:hypothetical protein